MVQRFKVLKAFASYKVGDIALETDLMWAVIPELVRDKYLEPLAGE